MKAYTPNAKIPYLEKSKIEAAAANLREIYCPCFPVEPEQICDALGIRIIALPGLKQTLDVDAYISGDFSRIYVDDDEYLKDSARNRFSVAHELGHYSLHKQCYPKNLKDHKELLLLSDLLSNRYAECQANCFAINLLVPESELRTELEKKFGNDFGDSIWRASHAELEFRLEKISKYFGVSLESLRYRIADLFPTFVSELNK